MNATPATSPKPRGMKALPKATTALKISGRTINGLAQVFKLLADESRLKILLALAQDGELNVTALCELLQQTQPAPARTPRQAARPGLVGYRSDGKHNFYRVESRLVSELLDQFFADAGNGHRQILFEDFYLAYKRR